MKSILGIVLSSTIMLFTACGSQQNNQSENKIADTSTNKVMDSISTKTFAASDVDNKKDPTCGMPVTAGISDTAHYEKYTIGFCSTECKNEFLKNPKAAIAAAEINK